MSVDIKGPKILWETDFLGFHITETMRNAWVIMILITLLCFWLSRGISVRNPGKKQIIAEKLVTMLYNLVESVMGKKYLWFTPYIGALFTFSMVGSLSGLVGARAMTGDLSTTLGWAILASVMTIANNIRLHGVGGWLKSYIEPMPFILPLNIVSEFANPISMAFRHFGNIASGIVISALVYGALTGLSNLVLANTFLSGVPLFQIGIPAVLSLYFDVFSSFLQAYIISMLTMVFVSGAE